MRLNLMRAHPLAIAHVALFRRHSLPVILPSFDLPEIALRDDGALKLNAAIRSHIRRHRSAPISAWMVRVIAS